MSSNTSISPTDTSVFSAYPNEVQAEEKCSICLYELDQSNNELVSHINNSVHHIFHTDCIERWLSSNASCPNCKAGITALKDREIVLQNNAEELEEEDLELVLMAMYIMANSSNEEDALRNMALFSVIGNTP